MSNRPQPGVSLIDWAVPECPLCHRSALGRVRTRPDFGKCACGLIANTSNKLIEVYRENYFTSEEPGRGHRDFESENAQRYDIVKFGYELDDIIGLPTGNKLLLDFGAATGSFLLI